MCLHTCLDTCLHIYLHAYPDVDTGRPCAAARAYDAQARKLGWTKLNNVSNSPSGSECGQESEGNHSDDDSAASTRGGGTGFARFRRACKACGSTEHSYSTALRCPAHPRFQRATALGKYGSSAADAERRSSHRRSNGAPTSAISDEDDEDEDEGSEDNDGNGGGDDGDEAVYEVEGILKSRIMSGQEEYLIRWKDFDNSHDSWVRTYIAHTHART